MTSTADTPDWAAPLVDPANTDRTYTPTSRAEAVNLKARGWLPQELAKQRASTQSPALAVEDPTDEPEAKQAAAPKNKAATASANK